MVDAPTRWLPFGLLPSAPEAGRPQPEILELRLPAGETDWMAAFVAETVETVQVWTVDDVLKNFALRAAAWHVTAREFKAKKRKANTTIDELTRWITITRSLADRLPFGGPLKGLMKQAAAEMERGLDWPVRFFETWPKSLHTVADAEWRVRLNLWAADRLLRAINETEREYAALRMGTSGEAPEHLSMPPTKFWPAMFAWFPADKYPDLDPAFADYNEAQKRVRRLEDTIKAGQRDALMVHLLREVLENGRFGPNEQDPHVGSLSETDSEPSSTH